MRKEDLMTFLRRKKNNTQKERDSIDKYEDIIANVAEEVNESTNLDTNEKN